MPEPSVLDYLKSLFDPDTEIDLNDYITIRKHNSGVESRNRNREGKPSAILFFLGVLLALFGQILLEMDIQPVLLPVILYITGGLALWKASSRGNFESKSDVKSKFPLPELRLPFLVAAIILAVLSFIFFGGHEFTLFNTIIWLASIFFLCIAIWQKRRIIKQSKAKPDKNFLLFLVIAVFIIVFFRTYQIREVPGEMYSDHAEKLLDVMDVISGKYPVFFERNTGREGIQFYVTAAIVSTLNTGFSFLSLKIGTIAFGLFTLPFIYLITKEMVNPWAGLLAFLLAGIAYWPNVISRVALRYSLYPLFTAPVLFFILKGLRERNTNYFLLGGLALGTGLHGYSAFRIVPLLVIFIFVIYFLSEREHERGLFALTGLTISGVSALFIFIPLLRYWMDDPGMFSYRALSRLTAVEGAIDHSPLLIFAQNFWDSLLMPFVDNGVIWVHSIPNRPALDVVTAAFYFIGLIKLVSSVQKKERWENISLLASIPILMLPSILSIAFPGENPSLNRSAGAYVPIFVIAGLGAFSVFKKMLDLPQRKIGSAAITAIVLLVVAASAFLNFQLVFVDYKNQFFENAWNTSEIGRVIADYSDEGGSPENAYVIPYPHWVDTRLVGFFAGQPGKDFALWREDISHTRYPSGNLLFIYKPQDQNTEKFLYNFFPDGQAALFYSQVPGKEFMIYTVYN